MLFLTHSRKSSGNPRKATNKPIRDLPYCTHKAVTEKATRASFGSLFFLVASLVVFSGSSALRESYAQQILYDNTQFRLDFSERLYVHEKNIGALTAQPFIMGDNGSIGSIRVGFARSPGDNGGIIPVSIWSDDGTGKPGEFVADVGVIAFETLPRFNGFPPVMPTSDFDTRIIGLTPGATYYVQFDFADVELGPGPDFGRNHLIHGGRRASDGTNGAGCVQIRHDSLVPEWSTLDETFLPGRC